MFSFRAVCLCSCIIFVLADAYVVGSDGCKSVQLNGGKACMCDIGHCDTMALPDPPAKGTGSHVYISSADGLIFERSKANVGNCVTEPDATITYDPNKKRQIIHGLGGSLTDAAASNIQCLPEEVKNSLLDSYFHPVNGIGYTVARTPIAGCDFSNRSYTYLENDKVVDTDLKGFKLTDEDTKFKIPIFQKILQRCPSLKVMASPWSLPSFMVKGTCEGRPALSKEYYKVWANYFIKYIKSYSEYGVKIHSVTTANEPVFGVVSQPWCLNDTIDFIKVLGPALKAAYPLVEIMTLDDQTFFAADYFKAFYNLQSSRWLKGIATHWYLDNNILGLKFLIPKTASLIHEQFPNKELWSTEACICEYEYDYNTTTPFQKGMKYASDIISRFLNYYNSWIDWNMALDMRGGPNHLQNYCDAPIRVDCNKKVFYKQSTFYAMAHFSKFIKPGSYALESTTENPIDLLGAVSSVSFVTPIPNPQIVTVIQNSAKQPQTLNIKNQKTGECSTIAVPAQSLVTVQSFA